MRFSRIIIPTEKKNGGQEYVDFRTRSLIAHTSKILPKTLACMLESKADSFLGRDQDEFRNDCGTRDATATMQVLCERNLEYNASLPS